MMLSPSALTDLRHTVDDLVRTHGEKLALVWQDTLAVRLKDARDPVTEFDVATENALRAALTPLIPGAGFSVEEGVTTDTAEYTWIIDPIDQTKNFVGHIPLFFTQVALMHRGEPVLAAIYSPVSKQLFSAAHGGGVTLNGELLTPPLKTELASCIVDVDFGGQDDAEKKSTIAAALARVAYRIRMSGGAYAPYLATGGIDAFVVLNQKTKIVDQAPRMLIARECGMRFEQVQLGTFSLYIGAGTAVYPMLHECIARAL